RSYLGSHVLVSVVKRSYRAVEFAVQSYLDGKLFDFHDCDEGVFESLTAEGWASDRYQQAPGQVDWLWILDVDGQRLVVDATYLADASAYDRSELDPVVRSIRFLD